MKYVRKKKSGKLTLTKAEYAKVYSEINTNYALYEDQFYCAHITYGIDNKPYWYYFENHGFNNYNIYLRIEDEEDTTWKNY